jgi:putative oxidoreductase
MSLVRRVARPMIASIFLIQGLDAFRHPAPLAKRSSPLLDKAIPALGLPNDKELLVRANGVTQMVGGVMLATGFLPRLGALAIASSLVPTTLAGHPFWKEEEPQQRRTQRIQFLKNMAMMGGVLLAAVDTAGKPGLAWRAQNIANRSQRGAKRAVKTTAREAKIAKQSAKIKVQGALG